MTLNNDKKLIICNGLIDKKGQNRAGDFCAPIYIGCTMLGTMLEKDEHLLFGSPNDNSVRNGTITFVIFKGEYFALTCRHVNESLEKRRKEYKAYYLTNYGSEPPFAGFEFFTPIGLYQHHFNYNFSPVPPHTDGNFPDVALARVSLDYITRLNRRPIKLIERNPLPSSAIAAGYPEQQREIRAGEKLNTLSTKLAICYAYLQITNNGKLLLEDEIEDHAGLDNLSGMSGGPFIWSDSYKFGLSGIIKEGWDIQPKADGISEKNSLKIFGESISVEVFEEWLKVLPPLEPLRDFTQKLITSENSSTMAIVSVQSD